MKPEVNDELTDEIRQWNNLSPWQRSELGRSLRRIGLSYGEIMRLIPVPKGTLAGWCREVELTGAQRQMIIERTSSQAGVPRDTQRKRRFEIERLRTDALKEVQDLIHNPLWLAGTVLYWGEGGKSKRQLDLTNSDPAAHRLFVKWVSEYLQPDPQYVLGIHLHEGNDEKAARSYWSDAIGLVDPEFHKTYVKPNKPGHRKNTLQHGVLRIRLRRSTDEWIRVMAWIDGLRHHPSVSPRR